MTRFETVMQTAFDQYQQIRADDPAFKDLWHDNFKDFWEWFIDQYIPFAYTAEFVETLFPTDTKGISEEVD